MTTRNFSGYALFVVGLFLLAAHLPSAAVRADVSPYYLNLNDIISSDFRPVEAFYLINFGGPESLRARARIIPSDIAENRWTIGTRISVPPGARRVSFALIVSGEKGQYKFLPLRELEVNSRQADLSNRQLARMVDDKAAELERLVARRRDYELSLARLRADAELIGEFSRVQEIRNKNEYYNQQLDGLTQDLENLRTFLGALGREGDPINFSRRESELTEQLRLLAAAAREAESNERGRIQGQRAREREELEMVRLTRDQNLEAIRYELSQLVAQRQEYENRLGINSERSEPDEKDLSFQ